MNRPRFVAWTWVTALTSVGFLLWLPRLLSQIATIQTAFSWSTEIWKAEFPWQVVRSLAAMSHGSLTPIRNRVAELIPSAWAGLAICLLLVVGAFVGRRRLREPRAPLVLLVALIFPLGAQFLYCWLRATPTYVVGHADSAGLPFLILLLAAGAHCLRPRLRWSVPAVCVGLAILPLEAHYRLDFKSQEAKLVAALEELRGPDEVLISTRYHHCLACLLEFGHSGAHLLFPSQAQQHPSWVDWTGHDPRSIKADAEAIAEEAILASKAYGTQRIWFERAHGKPYVEDMALALDAKLLLHSAAFFPELNCELRCYVLPPPHRETKARDPRSPSPLD
jgi:hypothetical protein